MRRTVVALLVLLGLGIIPVLAATKNAEPAAPTVAITAPESGVTFTSDAVEVTAVYTAVTGSTITTVELLVDDMVVSTATLDPAEETGTLTLTWETTGYIDGKYAVVVRVTDSKQRTAQTTISALLQRGETQPKAPIKISAPARGATVSGKVEYKVESEASTSVKYVIFLVDNVFKAMSNVSPFTYKWDTSGYLNGTHRLQARVYFSDGSDALTPSVTVTVDNPSGATTLRPPAATVTPAPTRTATAVLPPARNTVSPTPYSKTAEVAKAEIGTPGTAPYISAAGELVQPPTTVLAERTAAGSNVKVATVVDASAGKPAPTPAAAPSVSSPPVPSPTHVASEGAAPTTASPSTTAAESVTTRAIAPVRVAALPTPASVPSRTKAVSSLPPLGTAHVARAAEMTSGPAVADMAVTSPQSVAPLPATTEIKPPMQMALLPAPPATVLPAPKLIAEAAPSTTTYIVRAGDHVWGIAARYHITPEALIHANHLEQPDLITVGQRLVIPRTDTFVNDQHVSHDYPMQAVTDTKQARTVHLLSLRAVVEQLGGIVTWDTQTRQATAAVRGHTIVIVPDSSTALVDGKSVPLTVAPTVVSGRTLVPARFLADACEMTVSYEEGVIRLAEH